MAEQKYRSIEDSRHRSYEYFHVRKKVTLYFETDSKTVKIDGYVEQNDPGIFSKNEETQISVVCPYPWFKSLAPTTTVFTGIEPLFEFPFSNESRTQKLIIFGEIKTNIVESFIYGGDVEVGFVCDITCLGEVRRIRIMNLDQRQIFEIDTDVVASIMGRKIKYGDEIQVSTVIGDKYALIISEGEEFDIINAVKRNSDWPLIYPGENTFGYTAGYGIENMTFKLTYDVLYEGV